METQQTLFWIIYHKITSCIYGHMPRKCEEVKFLIKANNLSRDFLMKNMARYCNIDSNSIIMDKYESLWKEVTGN